MFLSSARQFPEARRLMEQAIARDPRYGPALAWAAICCFRLILDGRSEDPAADRLKGADFARRALERAGDDPGVLANAAVALAYFGEDIGAMMALVDRALALNPNFARGWHIGGMLRVWAGQPDSAIEYLEAALRLSPCTRIGTSANLIGLAHLFARRFDQAVPKLLLAIQDDPSFPAPYRFLAACYAHMGRLDDARETLARLRAISVVVMPDASHFRNAEHREAAAVGIAPRAGRLASATSRNWVAMSREDGGQHADTMSLKFLRNVEVPPWRQRPINQITICGSRRPWRAYSLGTMRVSKGDTVMSTTTAELKPNLDEVSQMRHFLE